MNFIVANGNKIIKDRRNPVSWYSAFECYIRNALLAIALSTALVSFSIDNIAKADVPKPLPEPVHTEQPMIPNYKVDKFTKVKKEELF